METLGKYTLRKKLATGGMAEIWLASVRVSGVPRICVVKRILPHLAQTPDFVRMFFDEARLVATLTHANIVQLYDVGEASGSPFIAMEYLHGADIRTIKRALRNHEPSRMPLEHAINIGIGVAAGLHYAHEKIGLDGKKLNIVHRDISPQNILVTYDGAVKVLDFGIAKSDAHRDETQVGTLKGKVPYMSPEQCACEPLDRRSDIYSLGVVLYELTTAHRVHPLGASEYEMIRSIVEGTLAPPTSVDPSYPKALEAIVLRCLAKDRRRRYPTARALQADLDAFAREARLAVSSLALSSYMGDLFGERAEAWREALAGGEARIVELASVATGADADAGDPVEAPPRSRVYGAPLEGRAKVAPPSEAATRAAIAPAPRTDAVVTKRRIGELTVVSIAGKLNERFSGASTAESLAGRVLLDLSGITRVTSFGVRAWLEMMGDATSREAEIFLCRCAEPVVNQMSMIKGFAGGGRVVSFHAPYRCEACGASWKRLFDCERDGAAIRDAKPPDADCPNCGAASVFDDDARSYLAFAAPFAGAQPPLDVRAAMDELGRADAASQGDPIEKTIDGRTTLIAVHAAIDAQIRWKRVLDGLEGDLEIDIEAASNVTPEGAAALDKALRALGPEVERIRIRGCPRTLGEALLTTPPSRAEILSIAIEGRCAACDAVRGALIDIREARAAAREKRDPEVPCKRCNAPLAFPGARRFIERLAGDAPDPTPSEPTHDVRTGAASVSSARSTAGVARSRALFAIGALVVGGATASVLLWPAKRTVAVSAGAATTSASAAPPRAPAASDPTPTWSDPPIVVEGQAVLAVGAGLGATEAAALAAAQSDAIDRLTAQLVDDLGDAPIAVFTRARVNDGGVRRAEVLAPLAARYLAQVGATSTPVRVDTHFRRRGAQIEALARYRLDAAAHALALAFYRATARLGGMTIAPMFPLLERTIRTTGAVIVIAIDKGSPAAVAGVREGDAILAVNGQAIASVDTIAAIASTPGPIEVRLDEGGAARVVKLSGR